MLSHFGPPPHNLDFSQPAFGVKRRIFRAYSERSGAPDLVQIGDGLIDGSCIARRGEGFRRTDDGAIAETRPLQLSLGANSYWKRFMVASPPHVQLRIYSRVNRDLQQC